MTAPRYAWFSQLAEIFNSGQSRSLLLHGDIHGLFFLENQATGLDEGTAEGASPDSNTFATDGDYLPLVPYLLRRCAVPGMIVLVYELNGPIRCRRDEDMQALREAWVQWKTGVSRDELILQGLTQPGVHDQRRSLEHQFDKLTREAVGQPAVALEFLRQLTIAAASMPGARRQRLMIVVEAADMLLPTGSRDIAQLNPADRQRLMTVQDWFADPQFTRGLDSVVLLSESYNGVHPRVTALPQVFSVEVASPHRDARRHYLAWFDAQRRGDERPAADLAMTPDEFADVTAGLSIHDLRQLLVAGAHRRRPITSTDVIERVEHAIVTQLGEGVVEFSKPEHTVDDLIGFTSLKAFLRDELIPRIHTGGGAALPGAAVAGPIGSGKTFIFEAVAGDLGLPVIVLKNIRSKWYGETDVIFEKLRRVLDALGRCIIFVDEADTQFGGVGSDTHDTERRLTGKVQAMMSDAKLKGRVVWILMTARIEALSPDIRRPGRVGDLIIPILDPAEGSDDHHAFVRWVLEAAVGEVTEQDVRALASRVLDRSAAGFAALRGRFKAAATIRGRKLTTDEVAAIVHDNLPADIADARRRQELHALLNCTRRSLLPDPNLDDEALAQTRGAWRDELRRLEG